MPEFTLQARRRTLVVMGILTLLALALLGRLLYLQIFQYVDLRTKAAKEVRHSIPIRAVRGHIFDRTGRPLVTNQKDYVLWVQANRFDGLTEAKAVVTQFCLKNQSADAVTKIMYNLGDGFYLCARTLDPGVAERLNTWIDKKQLFGVVVEIEPKRVYPYGGLVAPVLGYLREKGDPQADQVGVYEALGGVEQYYDDLLRGVDGYLDAELTPSNDPIAIGQYQVQLPRDGAQITLTLDLNIQYMAYHVLLDAIQKNGARRGDLMVMDPQSGAILAIVSIPTYDPADLKPCQAVPDCEEVIWRAPAIGRRYEPGSTMKILTVAIALEEHVIRPDFSFHCTGEFWPEGSNIPIHNWDGSSHGLETLDQILFNSCNVGAATIMEMIDTDVYYNYLERLGFGARSGVDIVGEDTGYVSSPGEPGWSIVTQETNAYGQGIAVTPLQLATAVAAVANGGELLKPYIVQEINQGGVITTTLPTIRGRIFHPDICRQVTDMLVAVGDSKGDNGVVPGYRVALKTGTASIPTAGGYERDRTIASAIGWAPADDPRFLILIRIEGNSQIYGDIAAVPALGKLAQFLVVYMHIPPASGNAAAGP